MYEHSWKEGSLLSFDALPHALHKRTLQKSKRKDHWWQTHGCFQSYLNSIKIPCSSRISRCRLRPGKCTGSWSRRGLRCKHNKPQSEHANTTHRTQTEFANVKNKASCCCYCLFINLTQPPTPQCIWDHEGNRKGDMSSSWGQPNTRVHTVLSRRCAHRGPGEGDVQMPLSCLPEP